MLLAGIAMGAAPVAHAQSAPPSLEQYTLVLREGFAAAQRNDRLGLAQVAPHLVAIREVALPDGTTVAIDNTWLQDELAHTEPDTQRISQRLGALLDALEQTGPYAPADATARLNEMLRRPPFLQEERAPSLLGMILDWLYPFIERFLGLFGRGSGNSASAFGWLATIGGTIVIIALLIYVVLHLRRGLVNEARAAANDPEAHLTAHTASEQAAALARDGDYRTGVRYMYLSALLWLDERDVLRYDRALTNREYLEHLRDNNELRSRLLPIVETFDRVWYGYAQLDAQSFEAYRQQVEALRQ